MHKKIFSHIYENNVWKGDKSVSGTGSDLVQTQKVRERLPLLLAKYNIGTILDIPCGDFFWMKEVDLSNVNYIGADIVPDIIEKNKQYTFKNIAFEELNLLESDLPCVDLIFCRDCLVHFSFEDIGKALKNIIKSKSKYLLTTSFVGHETNKDIHTGAWRPLDLESPPFMLPKPLHIINEECTENEGIYAHKSLCLWKVDTLQL